MMWQPAVKAGSVHNQKIEITTGRWTNNTRIEAKQDFDLWSAVHFQKQLRVAIKETTKALRDHADGVDRQLEQS